ncbi:DUF4419 domain-containing protein [Leptothoe kymatousa]|uniref:DUF4419 domain-containing protein n=1 Tax=Leptothoe kymatousa TAU-MAC 1615 TaxID=2364775 RepID=A0ABS5Y2B7_9CYAN|nr:DUF4419 domain-containing protein [Leptothoe kymatousa]MBT9311937.1 DUF4419 domain-containing protein [Leptothoe kymatousa TAU-MAC 1615]
MEKQSYSTDIKQSVKTNNSSIVFEVSDVSSTDRRFPEISYYQAVDALLKVPTDWREHFKNREEREQVPDPGLSFEACSNYRGTLLAAAGVHPFVAAVHGAFAEHRPLSLSPDMIWLLISQGLASHINVHADKLRSQFVQHQKKIKIEVRRDDFVKGSPENPWEEVFESFSAQIRQHVGPATHDLLIPHFSTTRAVEKAASELVLLDAMQPYFDYSLMTACGIPRIRLEGTVADWQDLLERTKRLAEFELQWWVDLLIPVLDQFIMAAQGQSDKTFWQSFYKFQNASGGPYITGWIIVFFPYLTDSKTRQVNRKNPWLIKGNHQLQGLRYGINNHEDDVFSEMSGSDFPSGLAKVPFRWKYLAQCFDMELLGGFVGVKQDSNDLFLRPEIGWVVREN